MRSHAPRYEEIPRGCLSPDEVVHVAVAEVGRHVEGSVTMLTNHRVLQVSDSAGVHWRLRRELGAPRVLGAELLTGGPGRACVEFRAQGEQPLHANFENGRTALEIVETLRVLIHARGHVSPVMEQSGRAVTVAEQTFLAAASRALAHEPYRYRNFVPIYRDILHPSERVICVLVESTSRRFDYRLLVLTGQRLLLVTDQERLDWRLDREFSADMLVEAVRTGRERFDSKQLIVRVRGGKDIKALYDTEVNAQEFVAAVRGTAPGGR